MLGCMSAEEDIPWKNPNQTIPHGKYTFCQRKRFFHHGPKSKIILVKRLLFHKSMETRQWSERVKSLVLIWVFWGHLDYWGINKVFKISASRKDRTIIFAKFRINFCNFQFTDLLIKFIFDIFFIVLTATCCVPLTLSRHILLTLFSGELNKSCQQLE